MFLIPKSSFKKFDPERSCFVLNEFAAAEFSSAIEMLFAAKVVDDKKLSIGFIRHALDEYKHCSIFTKIKNQMILEYKINKKELSFIPNHIYNKGYIYKDHFIFEKKKLNDFAIFIGANEEIAEKKLIAFTDHLKVHKPLVHRQIQDILKDINHTNTKTCVEAERNILKVLEGDCETAIGAYAQIKDGKISLEAELFSLDGKRRFYLKSSNEVNSASLLGKEMGKILKEKSENSYKK